MKNITISLFIISSMLFSNVSKAQEANTIEYKIHNALSSFYNPFGMLGVKSEQELKNKAYVFGFAIYVNSIGNIDSVTFTNKTKELDSLVSFDKIVKELKKEKDLFNNYKNTVLVSLVLVRRGWDRAIANVKDLDNSFYNIIPRIKLTNSSKKILLLPSFSLIYTYQR